MKPWPKLLAERYPWAPWPNGQRHPERPWWIGYTEASWMRYPGRGKDTKYTAVNQAIKGGETRPALAYMIDMDASDPLPFPGLRVGQTWAVNVTEMDAAVVTITEYDADHYDGRVAAWHPPGCSYGIPGRPGIHRPWHAGGAWITEAELLDLCRDGYLLADAVCPWLAPWAGVVPR